MGKREDKLSFSRQGENGMEIEIHGNSDTLRSMIHSALMSHKDLRSLLMPVITHLMQSDDFRNLCITDMVDDIGSQFGLGNEEDDEPFDTN